MEFMSLGGEQMEKTKIGICTMGSAYKTIKN